MSRSALVVEDGATHTALPAVRSLAADGWRVGVAAPRRSYAARSRFVDRLHLLPPLAPDAGAWAAALRRAARGYDVVIPAGDAEVLAVSAARDGLPAVPLPAHDVVLRSFDKLLVTEAAAAAGLAVPRTTPAETYDGRVPVVVKARHHWSPGARVLRWPAVLLDDADAVRERVAELAADGATAVVQDVVRGDLVQLVLLYDGTRVRAAVQQEAERIWPEPAGDLVRGRTVAVDPALSARAERLLRDLGWTGLVQLELLRPPGGEPHLVDFNGRVYGSVGLAHAAGVPFPALLSRLATGAPLPEAATPRTGVRWSALGRDVRAATGARERVAAVRAARGTAHAVWSASDPLPAFVVAAESVRRAARRLRRRAEPSALHGPAQRAT